MNVLSYDRNLSSSGTAGGSAIVGGVGSGPSWSALNINMLVLNREGWDQ